MRGSASKETNENAETTHAVGQQLRYLPILDKRRIYAFPGQRSGKKSVRQRVATQTPNIHEKPWRVASAAIRQSKLAHTMAPEQNSSKTSDDRLNNLYIPRVEPKRPKASTQCTPKLYNSSNSAFDYFSSA
jgi:hypothetical protein